MAFGKPTAGDPGAATEGRAQTLASLEPPTLLARLRGLTQARYFSAVLLAVIIGFALWLRLWGNNWDAGQHIHPDERFQTMVESHIQVPSSLGQYFNSAQSPFNPYNQEEGSFVYGTFPLFFVRIVAEVLNKADYADINLVGRLLSGLFDVGSVLLIFLVGRHLYGRKVGLLAAFLLTVTVLNIQHAHFFVVDSFLTFFCLLCIYYSVRIVKEGGWYAYAMAGVAFGLAVACKLNAVPLLGIVALAALIRSWPSVQQVLVSARTAVAVTLASRLGASQPGAPTTAVALADLRGVLVKESRPEPGATPWLAVALTGAFVAAFAGLLGVPVLFWPALAAMALAMVPLALRWGRLPLLLRGVLGLLILISAAFVVFRTAQPYAFAGSHWWDVELSQHWRDDMNNLRRQSTGQDFPPNIQWIGRTPFLFPLKNMVVWGMGPALGLAAWGGVLYAAWRTIARRESQHLLLVVWILGNFLYSGGRFVTAMRYFLPIYPEMVLLAAFGLLALWNEHSKWPLARRLGGLYRYARPAVPVVAKGALIATVVLTTLWALAFTSIYRRPLSRLEASEWIYENVPQGSALSNEHWDDALPMSFPDGRNSSRYTMIELGLYNDDSPEKVDELLAALDQTDYVLLTSNRLYGSIPRVPARYPVTTRYYELLFKEELGFEIAATFTSYPSLFGIEIPDQGAEEAFSVYDHPKVTIFRKTADYVPEDVEALLLAAAPESAVHLTPSEATTNGLILRPGDRETQQSGGTWTSLFDPDSLSNRFPAVTWLLVVQAAALALVPLAAVLFRSLPDGGYLLTKPLAILAMAYPVWLGASLKVFDFTRGFSLGIFLLLLLAGGLAAYRMRDTLRDYVRQHWRLILFGEALFLGAFLVLYLIRLNNPDLWHAARGGEKPMDFAYLNAVTRSTTIPPYDPWFGGGYINYYYFGQFMTGNLVKLTGILPEVAFNLAVPLFFAASVAAAFSVGYNLAEASRRLLRRRPGWLRIPPWTVVLAGLMAALLVTVVGNLKGADVEVDRLAAVSPWQTDIPVVDSVLATVGGGAKALFGGAELGRYDYWGPSRAIMTEPGNLAITEFPYFTFLFADLHAHLMAIPFTILSLGIGLALVLNASSEAAGGGGSPPGGRGKPYTTLGLVALLGLVVGALRWINSWDYPTFLIVALAVVLIAGWARAQRIDIAMLGRAVALGALLAALSWAFFLPFSRSYALPATGFQAMPDASEMPRTPFHQYLSHFGLFVFLVGSLLTFWGHRAVRRRGGGRATVALVATGVGVFAAATLVVGLAGRASGVVPGISITGLSAMTFLKELSTNTIPVAAFSLFGLAVVALLAWEVFRSRQPDAPLRMLVLGMVAMALVLSAAVEVAVLNPDIGRQNTVFKFYLQIWILLALASAFAVWYLAAALASRWDSLRQWVRDKLDRPSVSAPRLAFATGLVVLLVAALVYPIEATRWRVRLDDRFAAASQEPGRLVAAGGFTNNGLAFMADAVYQDEHGPIELKYDYDAIMWLRNNVQGSPVTIEAVAGEYRWGSRFAIYTGLPTVLGWRWHQTQQRGSFAYMVETRLQDVDRFYMTTDPDEAETILREYGVSLVILGQVERYYYPGPGLDKFDAMEGSSLELVYENPQTRIYRVVEDYLRPLATTPPS